jgi:hypothetical protein
MRCVTPSLNASRARRVNVFPSNVQVVLPKKLPGRNNLTPVTPRTACPGRRDGGSGPPHPPGRGRPALPRRRQILRGPNGTGAALCRTVPTFPCGDTRLSVWVPPYSPRNDLHWNLFVQPDSTYRRILRLAAAQASPRTLRFFRPLMMRPRARGLRKAHRASFLLFTTVAASPPLDLVR